MKQIRLFLAATVSFALLFAVVGIFPGQGTGVRARADTPPAQQTDVSPTGQVSLKYDATAMTATMSNEYYTIKFKNGGTGYSMVDNSNGKELVGTAKGFYLSVNGGTTFTSTSLKVVTNTPEMVDIAYCGDWGEIHYVMRSGVSGFYSYFVVANLNNSLNNIAEFRTLYRFDGSIFRSGYNSKQSGLFPLLKDLTSQGKLQDETWRLADGNVYSKYNWADYEADDLVHGLYGSSDGQGYGAWLIPVSNEYYNGGPLRQELMVHVESNTGDGVLLNMLKGSHFGAPGLTLSSGYIYGPWLVYMNNGSSADARARAVKEQAQWPYQWLDNASYPLTRTTVTGTLVYDDGSPASNAEVVLAQPGSDFYQQNGYIFYSQCDSTGHFSIKNVRPGSYSLYAYATDGNVTDEFERDNVQVSGAAEDLSTVTWKITRHDKLLWTIGSADRKADEFKLGDLPRQYGLPAQVPADLTYTIGTSTPSKDWYYAQTKVGSWDIQFNLDQSYGKNAYLTVPVAGVSRDPSMDIYVNGTKISTLDYSKENDAATYRSANQSGTYRPNVITFPASLLKEGQNTISFRMTSVATDGGIIYDMVKLEADAPAASDSSSSSAAVTSSTVVEDQSVSTVSSGATITSNPSTGHDTLPEEAAGAVAFGALAAFAVVVLKKRVHRGR